MCRELDRVRSRIRGAEFHWSSRDLMYSEIDSTCTELQMAIELSLKYLYKVQGKTAPRTHDVRILASTSTGLHSYKYKDELLQYSETITKWHTDPNYITTFMTTEDTVEAVFNIAKTLLEYVENYNPTEKVEDNSLRIQSILDRNNTGLKYEDIKDQLLPVFIEDTSFDITLLNSVILQAVSSYFKNKSN